MAEIAAAIDNLIRILGYWLPGLAGPTRTLKHHPVADPCDVDAPGRIAT